MRMNDADIHALAENSWKNGTWYEQDAWMAIHLGHFLIIHGRNDSDVYLVRCWLTTPRRDERGEWDSGNSLLLHFFARGDDDQSLHDHPWHFSTRILVGGYREHLPPAGWVRNSVGPAWNENTVMRRAGERIHHAANDLHCVGEVLPGTWTMVKTSPRDRAWGFHPPGQPWQPYADFLNARKTELVKS